MLERMQSKGNTPSLLVGVQTCKPFGNQYGGFSENWESIYLKTQQYHSWAYTQRMQSHTARTMFIAALFVIVRTYLETT